MMIESIEKYITFSKLEIAWRFENNLDVLKNIRILNEDASQLLWKKLLENDLISNYSLNSNRFINFEEKQFKNDYTWISSRLKELEKDNDSVILSWIAGQTILIDLKTFVDFWTDFFYSGSDDLVIINVKCNWVINLTHFECFQFGQGYLLSD